MDEWILEFYKHHFHSKEYQVNPATTKVSQESHDILKWPETGQHEEWNRLYPFHLLFLNLLFGGAVVVTAKDSSHSPKLGHWNKVNLIHVNQHKHIIEKWTSLPYVKAMFSITSGVFILCFIVWFIFIFPNQEWVRVLDQKPRFLVPDPFLTSHSLS